MQRTGFPNVQAFDPQVRPHEERRDLKRLSPPSRASMPWSQRYESERRGTARQDRRTQERCGRRNKRRIGRILDEICRTLSRSAARPRRVLNMRHFHTRSSAGWCCTRARSPRWPCGRGKTLVGRCRLPQCLSGRGAHSSRWNDIWPSATPRDGGVYTPGVSVGVLSTRPPSSSTRHEMSDPRLANLRPCTRQEAYGADHHLGTNSDSASIICATT